MITSHDQLPLGAYLDILALQERDMDDIDRRVAILAILTGKTEREVLNVPIADVSAWSDAAAFLERPAAIPKRIASSYRLGGFDLVPTTDLNKITTAQYIDFRTFAPEGDARLVELASVFLVPRGKPYADGYDIAEVQQAIREELTVTDALALSAFFLTRYAALIRTSRSFLARLARTETDKAKAARIRKRLADLETLVETLTSLGSGGAGSQPSTE